MILWVHSPWIKTKSIAENNWWEAENPFSYALKMQLSIDNWGHILQSICIYLSIGYLKEKSVEKTYEGLLVEHVRMWCWGWLRFTLSFTTLSPISGCWKQFSVCHWYMWVNQHHWSAVQISGKCVSYHQEHFSLPLDTYGQVLVWSSLSLLLDFLDYNKINLFCLGNVWGFYEKALLKTVWLPWV